MEINQQKLIISVDILVQPVSSWQKKELDETPQKPPRWAF